MKKPESFLKEYAVRLSDENLRWVEQRLSQKLFGDIPEAVNFMSTAPDMEKLLGLPVSCEEFFDLLDSIQEALTQEISRRQEVSQGSKGRSDKRRETTKR